MNDSVLASTTNKVLHEVTGFSVQKSWAIRQHFWRYKRLIVCFIFFHFFKTSQSPFLWHNTWKLSTQKACPTASRSLSRVISVETGKNVRHYARILDGGCVWSDCYWQTRTVVAIWGLTCVKGYGVKGETLQVKLNNRFYPWYLPENTCNKPF